MKWIESLKLNPQCNVRLICCHHSGGGASLFYPWVKYLSDIVEVAAIQLPGRETRFNEPLLNNLEDVIDGLTKEFRGILDKPYILFGHSLGGLICFELTRHLQNLSLRLPEHLIVSGCKAPHLPMRKKPIHGLPDDVRYYHASPYYRGVRGKDEVLRVCDFCTFMGNPCL